MGNEKQILKKALIGSTVMFIMTSIGHIIVYLCNREDEVEDDNSTMD